MPVCESCRYYTTEKREQYSAELNESLGGSVWYISTKDIRTHAHIRIADTICNSYWPRQESTVLEELEVW